MDIFPFDPASVQYDDWTGTIAGDVADMRHLEELLGINRETWRLLYVTIYFSGFGQSIEPYVVSADTSYDDLEATVARGEPIVVTHLQGIDYDFPNHSDTNPPRPESLPILSAVDFLTHGFKRLELKLHFRFIPENARFEVVEITDSEDFD